MMVNGSKLSDPVAVAERVSFWGMKMVAEVGMIAVDGIDDNVDEFVGLKRVLSHEVKSAEPIKASRMFLSCCCWMVDCGGGRVGGGVGEGWFVAEMW